MSGKYILIEINLGCSQFMLACVVWVHPDVRGDNAMPGLLPTARFGSPPRAWGQRADGWAVPVLVAVHPHVRGDNLPRGIRGAVIIGSPPRAWGQLSRSAGLAGPFRFTPTCVGTTGAGPSAWSSSAVHPHVRGDNWRYRAAPRWPGGSPPRAWGQRVIVIPKDGNCRFTPTCVGTTRTTHGCATSGSVHPHVRGDNGRGWLRRGGPCGSPPRAWGQQPVGEGQRQQGRFTPTCVGTTGEPEFNGRHHTVHPHVRGDNTPAMSQATRILGSPPRAWGQRGDGIGNRRHRRFTPTCVGTTQRQLTRH